MSRVQRAGRKKTDQKLVGRSWVAQRLAYQKLTAVRTLMPVQEHLVAQTQMSVLGPMVVRMLRVAQRLVYQKLARQLLLQKADRRQVSEMSSRMALVDPFRMGRSFPL